jgi:hypothetical protein
MTDEKKTKTPLQLAQEHFYMAEGRMQMGSSADPRVTENHNAIAHTAALVSIAESLDLANKIELTQRLYDAADGAHLKGKDAASKRLFKRAQKLAKSVYKGVEKS